MTGWNVQWDQAWADQCAASSVCHATRHDSGSEGDNRRRAVCRCEGCARAPMRNATNGTGTDVRICEAHKYLKRSKGACRLCSANSVVGL